MFVWCSCGVRDVVVFIRGVSNVRGVCEVFVSIEVIVNEVFVMCL